MPMRNRSRLEPYPRISNGGLEILSNSAERRMQIGTRLLLPPAPLTDNPNVDTLTSRVW